MWRDPIIEEIHAVREEIARASNYDLKRIMERLRKEEKEHSVRVIHKEALSKGKDYRKKTPGSSMSSEQGRMNHTAQPFSGAR
jgi:hypothetical protein